MTTQEIHSMRDKILEGIALSYSRLVESTIKNMDAAIRLRQARFNAGGRPEEVLKLSEENPITWLERPPAGYMGETAGLDMSKVAMGEWRFDSTSKRLYYRPRLSKTLSVGGGGDRVLGWHVPTGTNVLPVTPYRWTAPD